MNNHKLAHPFLAGNLFEKVKISLCIFQEVITIHIQYDLPGIHKSVSSNRLIRVWVHQIIKHVP